MSRKCKYVDILLVVWMKCEVMPVLDNPRHEKFCQLIAQGMTGQSAYTQVYDTSGKSAGNCASRLLAEAGIQQRVREIQEKAEKKAVLTIEQMHEFLMNTVLTPIGQIDEGSNLCQSAKFTDVSREFKMPDKLRAIELAAKLQGLLTEKKEVEITDKSASPIELAARIAAVTPLLMGRSGAERTPQGQSEGS